MLFNVKWFPLIWATMFYPQYGIQKNIYTSVVLPPQVIPPADANAYGRHTRDWLTNQNTDWCFVVIALKYTTIPQSFATAKNRSSSPTNVRHIGWHLVEAREYLLTSMASTVSRRIFIYIREFISVSQLIG